MPTPEQQPNTSHLQSLESELSLTKAELDEFKKLPKEEQERQKDEKLLELQRLNDKLDVAMQEAIKTGHLEETIKLKEQLEKEVKDLGEKVEAAESPENILKIDRTINLVDDFLKKSRTEGGLGIDWLDAEKPIDESDDRNEGLTEIDLFKVKLHTSWLPEGQPLLGGEERLEALKSKSTEIIRLDLCVLASMWKLFHGTDDQYQQFEKKLTVIAEANNLELSNLKQNVMFFDGTILKVLGGGRRALYLYWDGSGWDWGNGNLAHDWGKVSPSLVLAP